MKYNLCSACTWFQPQMLTATDRIPRSCNCPKLKEFFSPEQKGFPSGIDIIHCDYFVQLPPMFGDVFLQDSDSHGVSYILTQPRNLLKTRVPTLYNNEKNIKIIDVL